MVGCWWAVGGQLVLHNFTGLANGGGLPYGGVSLSPDGKTIYGMTWKGGVADLGVVYSLYIPTKAFRILHSFTVRVGRLVCSWWAVGGQLVGSWWAVGRLLVGSWWAVGPPHLQFSKPAGHRFHTHTHTLNPPTHMHAGQGRRRLPLRQPRRGSGREAPGGSHRLGWEERRGHPLPDQALTLGPSTASRFLSL